MLSVGEFGHVIEVTPESNSDTALVMLFFLFATFFTQITMLNMLIAIMGDTFEEALENKRRITIQTKIDILSQYSAFISK